MNKYTIPGPPFLFSSFRFYISNILTGYVSNRWILIGVSLLGLIFVFWRHKKWQLSIFLFLAIIIFPVLIVYVKGYHAPLRTFVVNVPFFAMLTAIGFCTLAEVFAKYKRILTGILLGIASIYAVLIFIIELKKIDGSILNDIKQGRRSQNLYYQYYSAYYQPLEDIRSFKIQYKKNELPVLIQWCEPHGVSNYLDKFDIPYSIRHFQPNALDLLLDVSDSIYVVTNHPSQFDGIKEFETQRLNQDLTYHNVVLLNVTDAVNSEIKPQLDTLNKEYKDSINFVCSVYDSTLYRNELNINTCYFITEENKDIYGELVQFVNTKPYLCYLETQDRNSNDISYIINDSFNVIENYKTVDGIKFFVAKKFKEDTSSFAELYFNTFDDIDALNDAGVLLDSTFSFSGAFSERLDESNTFSAPFSFVLEKESNQTILKVSFMGNFNKEIKALVVLDVMRGGKQIIWKGNHINRFFNDKYEWQKVIAAFQVEETLMPNDILKVYVWSPEKEKIWIDDLKIVRIR